MPFRELDVVRVAKLLEPSRSVYGSDAVVRQPSVGDVGAIVNVLGDDVFTVECVDSTGRTVWVADFVIEELGLRE